MAWLLLISVKKTPFMKKLFTLSAIALLAQVSCKCEIEKKDKYLNDVDLHFLNNAGNRNMAAVIVGQKAVSKGENEAVRSLANIVVADYTNAQADLHEIILPLGHSLPSSPDSACIELSKRLAGMNGYSFDTAYIHAQVKEYQQLSAMMQNEINNGYDELLRAYASRYLPVVQRHYFLADSISNSL